MASHPQAGGSALQAEALARQRSRPLCPYTRSSRAKNPNRGSNVRHARSGIFENNCFTIRKPDAIEKAIFITAARINHSCLPNCSASWDRGSEKLYVYAIRYIQVDEELTIAYDSAEAFYQCWEIRRTRSENKYGFVCRCPACDMESPFWVDIEKNRTRIATISAEIQELLASDPKSVAADMLRIEMYRVMTEQGYGTWEAGKAWVTPRDV